METKAERRLRKLIDLTHTRGGISAVASIAGLKPVYLDQILKGVQLPIKKDGTRSARSLGDSAARAIEEAFGLGRGWFDNDGDDVEMTASELQLLGYFRSLDAGLRDLVLEHVRQAAEQKAQLTEELAQALKPRKRQAPTA